MTRALKPKVRDDLHVVEIEGEAVVYDKRRVDLTHLNAAATVVFNLCDGTGTVKEMSEDIAQVFRVPEDQVQRQVRSVLRQFKESGYLDGYPVPEHQHRTKRFFTAEDRAAAKEADQEHADHDHDDREEVREKKKPSP
jgi:hypothetical protein